MGQWVRCTLESDEKQGEQKLVRHLNLDYYVRMERNPNNTTLLRSVSGAGDMHVMEKSCSRKGSDCNQQQLTPRPNEQAFIPGSVVTGRSTKNRRVSRPKPDAP
jgi:hypothetical protein